MTVQECIEYVDSIEPNAYTAAQKAGWLSECEGKVYTALFLVQPYEFTPITAADSRVLALPAPYDRMYPRYLQAMIHYANGEYDRYANSMAAFNEVWAEANRWFGGDYDVTDRLRNRRFEDTIMQELGDQVIMEIPKGCAIAAGRVRIAPAFRDAERRYYAWTELPAGTYCMQLDDGSWGSMTLGSALPAGTSMELQVGSVLIWAPGSAMPQTAALVSGKSGTELAFTASADLWHNDPANIVARADLRTGGTTPLPMITGGKLGITLRDLDSQSTITMTGYLLIPDQEWAYEDRYSRRRDARWRG